MEVYDKIVFADFAVVPVGLLIYAFIRLRREAPPDDLSPRSQRLARLFAYPRFIDAIYVKALNKRETWLVLLMVAIGALGMIFGGKR